MEDLQETLQRREARLKDDSRQIGDNFIAFNDNNVGTGRPSRAPSSSKQLWGCKLADLQGPLRNTQPRTAAVFNESLQVYE